MSFYPNEMKSAKDTMNDTDNANMSSMYPPFGGSSNQADQQISPLQPAFYQQNYPLNHLQNHQQNYQQTRQDLHETRIYSAFNEDHHYLTGNAAVFNVQTNRGEDQTQTFGTQQPHFSQLGIQPKEALQHDVAPPRPGIRDLQGLDSNQTYSQLDPHLSQVMRRLVPTGSSQSGFLSSNLYSPEDYQPHLVHNNLHVDGFDNLLDEFTNGENIFRKDGTSFGWEDFDISGPRQELFFGDEDETEFDYDGFVAFYLSRCDGHETLRASYRDAILPGSPEFGSNSSRTLQKLDMDRDQAMALHSSFSGKKPRSDKKTALRLNSADFATNAAQNNGQRIVYANEAAYLKAIVKPTYDITSDCPTDDAGKRAWIDKIVVTLIRALGGMKKAYSDKDIERKAWDIFIMCRDDFHGLQILSVFGSKKYGKDSEVFEVWSDKMNAIIEALSSFPLAKNVMDEPFIPRIVTAPAAESGKKKVASNQAARKKLNKAINEIAKATLEIKEAEDESQALMGHLKKDKELEEQEIQLLRARLREVNNIIKKAQSDLRKAQNNKASAELEVVNTGKAKARAKSKEDDAENEPTPTKRRKLRQVSTEIEQEMRSADEATTEPVDPEVNNEVANEHDDASYRDTNPSRDFTRSNTGETAGRGLGRGTKRSFGKR